MSKKTNYHQSSFWEERYKQNICQWYEWLATPNQIAKQIQGNLPEGSKILELGCGSSNLADKLMALHHTSVTCLDYSKQVIKNKQKHAKQGITYQVHDITQPLPFEEGSFDVIVEKNTLDCLFCFDDFPQKVMRTMKECYRVLRKGGVMVSFSHGKEKTRKFFYRNRFSPFDYDVKIVKGDELKPGQPDIFVYILTKEKGQNMREQNGDQMKEEEQKKEEEGLQDDEGDHEKEPENDVEAKEEESSPRQLNQQGEKQPSNSPEDAKQEYGEQDYEKDDFDIVE